MFRLRFGLPANCLTYQALVYSGYPRDDLAIRVYKAGIETNTRNNPMNHLEIDEPTPAELELIEAKLQEMAASTDPQERQVAARFRKLMRDNAAALEALAAPHPVLAAMQRQAERDQIGHDLLWRHFNRHGGTDRVIHLGGSKAEA